MQTKKFYQKVIQNKHSRKVALKPARQTLTWCERLVVLREVMCLLRNNKSKSEVLSGGFCLRDSETGQKTLQFMHM